MRNIILIARREYLEQIRGRAFRLTTVLVPALFAAIFFVSYLSNSHIGGNKHLAIASNNVALAQAVRNQLLKGKTPDADPGLDIVAPATESDRAQLVERVRNKSLDGLLWITATEGQLPTATYTSPSAGEFTTAGHLHDALNNAIIDQHLVAQGMAQDQINALDKGIHIETFQVRKDGSVVKSNALASFFKGYVMAILLSMTTIMYGLNVARSIIQEKTSRIFEVMLSIAKPGDLLAGKLIGVGCVGLTQILIWVVAGGAIIASPLAAAQMSGNLEVHFSWIEAVLFPTYFVLGYFLYSSLFAGLAATCETEQELQMYTPLAAVPVWLSFALIMLVINDSNSFWSVAASFFPPCAPIIMFLRMGAQVPPAWQIAVSIGLMILSIWAVLAISTRLYRIGILMYGKRATLPEILRWLRYS